MAELGKHMLDALWGPKLGWALRAYAKFALAHMAYKMVAFWLRAKRFKRDVARVPGENVDWTMQTYVANINRIHDYCTDMVMPHRKEPLSKWSLPEFGVVVNSGEGVRKILRDDFAYFTKHPPHDDLFSMIHTFLGKGIFTLRHGPDHPEEHKEWHMHRKLASKLFTKRTFVELMADTFETKSNLFIRQLEERTASAKSEDADAVVDMQDRFFWFTFASIDKIFYGTEENERERTEEYAACFDEAHRAMMAFLVLGSPAMLISRFVLPFPFGQLTVDGPLAESSLTMALMHVLHPVYRTFRKNVRTLNEITTKRISKIRTDPAIGSRRDLISAFLTAQPWTDAELRAVVLNFTIAGRDTTACLLSWLFFELSIHPEIQEKLRKEVVREFGHDTEHLDYDVLMDPTRMPYLNGCVYEALRKWPPVPIDQKMATRDMMLFGTRIEEGTLVAFSNYAMGRNPDVYPDPDVFRPERWIPFEAPDEYSFPVFQAVGSPRGCLGSSMAKFEAKFLVSRLLQRFKFALAPSESAEKISYSLSLTMAICNERGSLPELSKHELNLVVRPLNE
ncbi:Cytochrome P450 704C1 [Hondaea fermentalgiana]|uniref:Cytochrome P450 704C1 n=1 Tax=Hondaea fermentalgiana TaxID=2315210 RepID=A0A2R5GN81_9STRA|nr:Cytochrome P450 704C1 [Hondaea fermentalgiana]|eukprot:GBG29324.1 Cytochrome P450 704C1 [Hondaea fermentalgiana]